MPDYLWPTPSLIVSTLVDNAGGLASDTWVTLREVIYGFLIAVAAGLGIGIALAPLRNPCGDPFTRF